MKKAILIIIFGLLLSGNAYAKTYRVHYSNYFDKAVGGSSYGTKSFKNSKDEALLKCKNESETKNIKLEGCLLHDFQIYSALDTLFNTEIEKIVWNEEVDKFEKTLKPEDIIEGIKYKSKIQKKEEKEEDKTSSMIERAKSTCKELGFKEEETEKFNDCKLKVYTQLADAEAAVEAAKSTKQGQTVIIGQRKIPKVSCKVIDGVDCF